MKTFRARSGPFLDQYYYDPEDFELIGADALRGAGLLPSSPEPIRVDRFIEKGFDIVPRYENLPAGLLGFTRFGPQGAKEIVISEQLSEGGGRSAERRITSTLAHEAGHILLHGSLFTLQLRTGTGSLMEADLDAANKTVLCRDDSANARRYDGRWWEYQANQMIGALLLPRSLVIQATDPLITFRGQLGIGILESDRREEAVQSLAETFDVNPMVARIRVEQIYPESEGRQLTL
jgi:hypothetical protein